VTSANLENLAKIGQLKREPPAQAEVDGLLKSGRKRLKDAGNASNEIESRYLVFQVLPHTLGMTEAQWRVLALCHDRRNKAEYEGTLEVDERLLAELIAITGQLLGAVEKLGP